LEFFMRTTFASLVVITGLMSGCDDSKTESTQQAPSAQNANQNPGNGRAGVGNTASQATSGGGRNLTTAPNNASPGGGADSAGDPTNRP
jgi:hypothetical protein